MANEYEEEHKDKPAEEGEPDTTEETEGAAAESKTNPPSPNDKVRAATGGPDLQAAPVPLNAIPSPNTIVRLNMSHSGAGIHVTGGPAPEEQNDGTETEENPVAQGR